MVAMLHETKEKIVNELTKPAAGSRSFLRSYLIAAYLLDLSGDKSG